MKKIIQILIILLFAFLFNVNARDFRVGQVPNGNKFSCNTCHTNGGGTPRNSFGQLIESQYLDGSGNVIWNEEIAMIDSDGDGFTNGEELQDPHGTWETNTQAPGSSNLVTNPGNNGSTPTQNVILATSEYGEILTDLGGYTLYYFVNDAFDASVCFDQCETNWPVYYKENILPGDGLNQDDFASITRLDGSKQTTYKGWPLYYFFNDTSPGDVNGENINGVWFVAKPDYSVMLVNNQLVGHDGIEYNSNYEQGQETVKYFVDGYGRTLYTFINDEFNKNKFTKEDFSNNPVWPIYETENIVAPSSIDASLFNIIDVFGKKQLTYNGWPLYYFGQDSMMRGKNKGISFPAPGVWPVAIPSLDIATDIENENVQSIPQSYMLSQNYPNPFNPTTTISFNLVEKANVKLNVYNVLGQLISTLINSELSSGLHQVNFDANEMQSGTYFYKIETDNFSEVKKMLLLK
ncbi:MAG: T9SS type A sorting domain-containing protein [Ignavibacteriales bacterium]|nr:T9SS type A sorting domain-containing protein [Ignavibacteriales bacterium]MCB9258835.1 T9SS type A sorting domain-containing protein [Ignavibacteriales bacterium]